VNEIGATVPAKVLRLDPRRRTVTIGLPSLGKGAFRTDVALPGEELAGATEFGYGSARGRVAGGVTAVRRGDAGCTEVDLHVTSDRAWQRLGERGVRVRVRASFSGSVGPNPTGGRVTRVEID
jgi:hypothetical protein